MTEDNWADLEHFLVKMEHQYQQEVGAVKIILPASVRCHITEEQLISAMGNK